jgi:UDP-glucose 4-epimerase
LATYVVTGGAGFIGSHISEELIRQGHSVRIVDDFSSGKPANIETIEKSIQLFNMDIGDSESLAKAFRGAEYVIHQAAIVSVPKSMDDPARTNRVNLDGTLSVLVAARDAGVKRVVFASSAAVYGNNPVLPKHEDMTPEPVSPYGAQKYCSEVYCRTFWRAFQVETVVLRYFNVFGPRQDPKSPYSGVMAKFIPAVLSGIRPTIFGDGMQSRDLVFVSNIVDANLAACTTQGIAGEVFNIARDRVTVNDMLQQINIVAGKNIAPLYAAVRDGDILHSQADLTRARSHLNYEARVSFKEGLRRTVDWYRENQ